MLTVQNSDVVLDFDLHTGLGWMLSGLGDIDIRGAGTVAHHSGRTLLFNSQIIALPREKLGVVVLANSTEARQACDTIATAVLTRALEAKTGRPLTNGRRRRFAQIPQTLRSTLDHTPHWPGWYLSRRKGIPSGPTRSAGHFA